MATLGSSLEERAAAIQSREDLVGFVRELLQDFRTNPDEWENPSLESYLDALASWSEDMEGYFGNRGEVTPREPSWKLLGAMLLAAKVYE